LSHTETEELRDVFRLSFDFTTEEAMNDFWKSFTDVNRQPTSEESWDDCYPQPKDGLHDINSNVTEHLVRRIPEFLKEG
jgi:hypothetical protein